VTDACARVQEEVGTVTGVTVIDVVEGELGAVRGQSFTELLSLQARRSKLCPA
jgi:hypothetical protein